MKNMIMSANNSRSRYIIYRVTTVMIAGLFFITGLGNLLPFSHIAHDMAHLGYPAYFLKILGSWKILAAIAILIPRISRIKEWAYAGMMFDLTGAALSRYAMDDPLPMIIIPLGLSILVTVNYAIRRALQSNVSGASS
jgi:uncharacterized membrane protein YphA (DoxX/SURF4 family)